MNSKQVLAFFIVLCSRLRVVCFIIYLYFQYIFHASKNKVNSLKFPLQVNKAKQTTAKLLTYKIRVRIKLKTDIYSIIKS